MALRGGSTKIIMCGAETSDPLAPVRGSFESRDRDPSNKKNPKWKNCLSCEKCWFPWGEPWFQAWNCTNSPLKFKHEKPDSFTETLVKIFPDNFFTSDFFIGRVSISTFEWAANEHQRISSFGAAHNYLVRSPPSGPYFNIHVHIWILVWCGFES